MPTSATGQTTSGRANHAKKPSANKDLQTQEVHQQLEQTEGPPYKKRRTDNSHDSVVEYGATGRKNRGARMAPEKTLKRRKSLELNHFENIGPRPLLEPPEGKKPQNDTRVLRSQDGTGHGSSDLVLYFEEYYSDVFGDETVSRKLRQPTGRVLLTYESSIRRRRLVPLLD